MAAPMHALMIPREGSVHVFNEAGSNKIGQTKIHNDSTFENVFDANEADGVIVIRKNTVLFEKYWNGLSRHYQHIWFSMTKSLTSSAFGILVAQNKVDLNASPVKYVPELKGTPWERTTIQDVLNMSTALGFQESYTDTANFFYKSYGNASTFFPKTVADNDPKTAKVLGTYDFLTKMATPNNDLQPGVKFEYSSPNVDVISWIISSITGKTYNEFIQENLWNKLGAEHDAYINVDQSYTAVATGGMNSTLRDLASFGTLILDRGKIDGKQILPQRWVDETLRITQADKDRYLRNDVYVAAKMPWVAYKNYWWILDDKRGEYCAVGIHGQVLYINRSAGLVIAYFSSQPNAGSVASKEFLPKLNACRELAKKFDK
jgi:CubicO group peptidase (beta-lactamase class C family)